MNKIGIFYAFNTVKTARCAKKILKQVRGNESAELVDVLTLDEATFLSYNNLILGVPTWFDGELPTYWDEFVPSIEETKLEGKRIAIFGLGDQKGYPENFVDGIGLIAVALEERGAEIVGLTSIEGYKFEKSLALRNNKFLGLAIDIENQAGLTDERIINWVKQLQEEFKR